MAAFALAFPTNIRYDLITRLSGLTSGVRCSGTFHGNRGDASAARREYSEVLQKFALPDELRRRVEARRDALSPQ